ncbi:MAG: hypothetical protein IPJ65_01205 [Archangiaceae bacterium]|nr:hypothetical protein [Archangiaceae bacterium]
MNERVLAVLVLSLSSLGCNPQLILRGSSNDFLKHKATIVSLNLQPAQIQPVLDELFFQRGFRPASTQTGDKGSVVVVYKGSRPIPPDAANVGINIGSWYAARVGPSESPGITDVEIIGKPMVGVVELCSDHDKRLNDIKYTCNDTKVPPDWAGKHLVTGRDETEVVSWVLTGLYERLKR